MASMLLKSSDGASVRISLPAASLSGYFRTTISDESFDAGEPLLVPRVAYEELRRSCLFCENLPVVRKSLPFQTKTDTATSTSSGNKSSCSGSADTLPASVLPCNLRRPLRRLPCTSIIHVEKWWDAAYVAELSFCGLVKMAKAADFLNIPELSCVVSMRLAWMLRGKSPNEMCQILSCATWWSRKLGGLKKPASEEVVAKKKPASNPTKENRAAASVLKRPAGGAPAVKKMRCANEADGSEGFLELEIDQEFDDVLANPRTDADVWKEAESLGTLDYACSLASCQLAFPRAPLHYLLDNLKKVEGDSVKACDSLFEMLSDCNHGFDVTKMLQLGSRRIEDARGDLDERMLAKVASFMTCADSVALHLALFRNTRARPEALLYEDLWFDSREAAIIKDGERAASEQLHLSTLRLLIDLGADSNALRKKSVREYDDEGRLSFWTHYVITALGWAVRYSHVTAVEVLVGDHGADASLSDLLSRCFPGHPRCF